ncbi:MAG: pyruvate formate-lyase-activating protein [Hungatella sp.]
MTVGHVHSIESFGTVDGPGIRMVIFLKGCPMRCLYCHNPDTWEMGGGTDMTVEDILRQFEASRAFYATGGITVSGGEPLMQTEFVTELFLAAAHRGIHTCLDTSGITFHPENPALLEQMDRLMTVTDLVLLDIKHIDSDRHRSLCAHPNDRILAFAHYLDAKAIPVWIRHVVVPGLTDQEDALYRLGKFIGTLHNVKALDVLPYHDMGKVKYEQMGLLYPLQDVTPLSPEAAAAARQIILNGIRASRLEKNA